jgi:peptidoglycan/xylan/chitin deacetylase (PgdA/CDA1 family)
MYHRITTDDVDPWGLAVSPARFDEQVRWLTAHRTVLPLTELARLHQQGRLPRAAVAITADDGYACNAVTAAPILESHRAPATFFVATGPVTEGREFWWDELLRIVLESPVERLEMSTGPRPVSRGLGAPAAGAVEWRPWAGASTRRQQAYLDLWDAVRALDPAAQAVAMAELRDQAGLPSTPRASHRPMTVAELRRLGRSEVIDIGSHTVSHPSLPLQPPALRTAEIERARETCAELVGRAPAAFAYPFGDYDAETVELVRAAGHVVACTTDETGVVPGADVLALPRLQVLDWSADDLAKRLRVL